MPKGELLTSEIRGKLARLRRGVRRRLAGEGAAWLILVLVGIVFCSLGIDYSLHLDRVQRALVMAIALGAVGWIVWKQLIAPLAVSMGSADLALLVEDRYDELDDRLISAIQFAQRDDLEEVGASTAMVEVMAEQANRLAAPLDFSRVVDHRRLWRVVRPAVAAAMLLIGFAIWQADTVKLWAARNLAFSDVAWPQETYLVVHGGPDYAVLRGDDLVLTVGLEPGSVEPPSVLLHTRYPSGRAEEEIKPTRSDGVTTYTKTFQAVAEPFEFYVTGGDDFRDEQRLHRVTLIDPPAWRDVRFTLEYPAYTQRPSRVLDGSGGVIGVPVGGQVRVWAAANKPLESARILVGPDEIEGEQMRPAPAESGQGDDPTQWVGQFGIGGKNEARTTELRFALRDTDGHENRRGPQFVVQVQADQAPNLEFKKQGVGSVIAPQAIIPLVIRAKDEYGVAAVRVVARTGAKGETRHAETVEDIPAGQQELQVRHHLDLQPRALIPGDLVRVSIEADDTLPKEYEGPNTGASSSLEFRVVKAEDLMAELVRRQKALRLEFVQVIALQESARAKTSLAAEALKGGQESPEIRRQLSESTGMQSNVGAECARTAESLQAILEEMTNNRLGSPEDRKQLADGIIQPLAGLAEPMDRLVATMNGTALVTDPGDLRTQATEIAGVQEEFRKRMEAILDRMQKLQSRQELANQLRVIIKWSEGLLDGIKKQAEEEAGGVFDPKKKKKGADDE